VTRLRRAEADQSDIGTDVLDAGGPVASAMKTRLTLVAVMSFWACIVHRRTPDGTEGILGAETRGILGQITA